MGGTRQHVIRQALTARIAALSPSNGYSSGATGYGQAATDAWRESEEPLFPEWEPGTRAHLGFFVDDRELEDTRGAQSTTNDEPIVTAPLVIRFNARIRGGKKHEDWDAAGKAALHVLRSLLVEGWTPESFEVHRSNRPITRIPIPGAEFVLVEVRVIALYQLSLAEYAA